MNVDCETGTIEEIQESGTGSRLGMSEVLKALAGKKLPDWDETQVLIRSAHTHLSRIRTIAWDLALTPNGPCLIEGNSTWGEETLQTLARLPALKSKLRQVYAESVTHS